MKTKIKVKLSKGATPLDIIKNGDWIDLRVTDTVEFNKGDIKIIGLGIAMQLPKGFEAMVLPRSSTPTKFNIVLLNSEGVIDNSYCGDDDEWKFSALALNDTTIPRGSRIAQFRIQLNQKATMWQKLKWLFSNGIKVEYTSNLNNPNRGGIGSTGRV